MEAGGTARHRGQEFLAGSSRQRPPRPGTGRAIDGEASTAVVIRALRTVTVHMPSSARSSLAGGGSAGVPGGVVQQRYEAVGGAALVGGQGVLVDQGVRGGGLFAGAGLLMVGGVDTGQGRQPGGAAGRVGDAQV
ncbi:hypothetical protein [Streptomyces sp. S186]|uniref:hypothetical protein n=1 Tax=Streptomyces sp. S186 TaxID=3434395 RepID=UPI003F67F1E7